MTKKSGGDSRPTPTQEEVERQLEVLRQSPLFTEGQIDLLGDLIVAFRREPEPGEKIPTGTQMVCELEQKRGLKAKYEVDYGNNCRKRMQHLRRNLEFYNLKYHDLVEIQLKKGDYKPIIQFSESKAPQVVGNLRDAVRYLSSRIPTAKRVEDTTIRWTKAESPYVGETFSELVTALSTSRAQVVSITGPTPDDGYVKALRRAFRDGERGRLKCYRLHHTVPIMNFVLLTYFDDTVEVLFGYGALNKNQSLDETSIFRSVDPRLVEEFRLLFSALCSRDFASRVEIDDPDLARARVPGCDVVETFSVFPHQEIGERLETCNYVTMCAPHIPSMAQLDINLKRLLERGARLEVVHWTPDDVFLEQRADAVGYSSNHFKPLVEALRTSLEELRPYGDLRIWIGEGAASVTLYWLDDAIYFGVFWRGQNASQGPHFRVDANSQTGYHLRRQLIAMVPSVDKETRCRWSPDGDDDETPANLVTSKV